MASPDFSGYLTKRSMWLKEWRRRYFELRGDELHFSEGQGKPSHGCISLRDCLTVKSAEEKTKKKFSFEVATPDSTFYMYASSEKEKDEWIGAIGRAIVRSSGAFRKKAAEESSSDDDSSDEGDNSPPLPLLGALRPTVSCSCDRVVEGLHQCSFFVLFSV